MNCAYQYSHNGHPQNVMTIAPTAPQQGLHPAQETEYLEVGCRDYIFLRMRAEIRLTRRQIEGTSNFSDLKLHECLAELAGD